MFDFFISFFNIVLYQPLFNGLILLYEYLPGHDFGVAIIVLTVLIRVMLYPLGTKSIEAQKAMSVLQPKIKDIQQRFKADREKQAKAMMELYQKEKINPFSGCLPLLIQLPIIIALYRVFWRGFEPEQMSYLYSFITSPGIINPNFLGVIDLAAPSIFLAVIAGVFQFFQSKMIMPQLSSKKESFKDKGPMAGFSDIMQKQMLYFFPIFTILILWKMPSAIGLYWITFTLFAIVQQHFTLKKNSNVQIPKNANS